MPRSGLAYASRPALDLTTSFRLRRCRCCGSSAPRNIPPQSRIMSTTKPTLFIATESKICDISPWANEGYDIHLLTEATSRDIENAVDDLESHDKYAIIGRYLALLSSPKLT
jgi:hypothetical protein